MLVDGRDDEAQRVDGDAGDGRRRLGRTGDVVRPGQRHERAVADADGHHHGGASDERHGAPAIDGDVLPEDHRATENDGDARHDGQRGERLGRDVELSDEAEAERDARPDRRAVVRPEKAVDAQDHQRRDGLEQQEEMGVGGRGREGREPVGQPADERRRPPADEAPGHDEEAHRRCEDGEVDQHVERGDGTEEERDGEGQDAEQGHRRVVHQVDADGRVQPVVDERIVAVQQDPGRLGEEPDLLGDVVAPRRLQCVGDPVGPGAPVRHGGESQIDEGHPGGDEPASVGWHERGEGPRPPRARRPASAPVRLGLSHGGVPTTGREPTASVRKVAVASASQEATSAGRRRGRRGAGGPARRPRRAYRKLKSGTPELMPLKSSPLAATSSSGDHSASRVTWPTALNALTA